MMNTAAITILQSMIDGIDPVTGEILSDDHFCNHPNVLRALHTAILELSKSKTAKEKPPAQSRTKLNAGRPWTDQDLKDLERLYCAGTPMESICSQLQRRERGVKKQLVYLGFIQIEAKPGRLARPGLERAGLPWTRDEDRQLKLLHSQRLPVSEISTALRRTDFSIFCRMEKLELYGEEYGYPAMDTLGKWSNDDTHRLRELFQAGQSIEELALHFNRPKKSISARLFYMGLIRESPLPHLKK